MPSLSNFIIHQFCLEGTELFFHKELIDLYAIIGTFLRNLKNTDEFSWCYKLNLSKVKYFSL